MNEKVLESFINMCDEMLVSVEESLKTIKLNHDEATEKIKNIKEKISKEDDITKIIALNNECISELNKYIKLIDSDKESPLDKVKEFAGPVLALFGFASLGMIGWHTEKKSGNISKGDYIAFGTSAISLIGALIGFKKTGKKYDKGHTQVDYANNIRNLKNTIASSNTLLNEAKRLNINKYSDLSENYIITFSGSFPVIIKK